MAEPVADTKALPPIETALEAVEAAEKTLREAAATGVKCGSDGSYAEPILVEAIEAPKPYGGAMSFADVRQFEDAVKTDSAVWELSHVFSTIVSNIFAADSDEMDLSSKAKAVTAASKELQALLGDPSQGLVKTGLRESVMSGIAGFMDRFIRNDSPMNDGKTGFFSFKTDEGWRWLSVHSNNRQDRNGEIFTEAAHKEYVAAVDATGRFPELWLWHTPGTRVGVAEFVDYADGFVVSAGRYDPGMDHIAEKLYADRLNLDVSHGYKYPSAAKENGVINRYFSFEVSPLPRGRASNCWTAFDAAMVKEDDMFRPEKKAFLVDYLGAETTAAVEEGLEHFSKELDAAGIGWKELDEALSASVKAEAPAGAVADPATPDPKPEPDPDDEGDEEDAGSDDAGATALEGRVSALETAIGQIATGVNELVAGMKELEKSDDEKISDLSSPRRRAPDPDKRPTASNGNVIQEEAIAGGISALKEALDPDPPKASPVSPFVDQLIGAGVRK